MDYSSVESYGVSRESFEKLVHYHALLVKWQKAINLVGSKSLPDAWQRHFIDSVQLLRYLPQEPITIADLGSGGGFAGLVIAICRPDIAVNLIDSDMRKCQFLRTVSRESSLENVTVHNERVEAVLGDVQPDLIMARGFASLSLIFDICDGVYGDSTIPSMLLLKGNRYDEELLEAEKRYNVSRETFPSVTDSMSRILRIIAVNKL